MNPSTSLPSSDGSPKLGEYAIIRTLGEGTFSKVYLAVHTLTGQKVALKFIQKRRIQALKMRTRVSREIEYLKLLKHPHIIKLYEVINTPTDIIMVIEYAGGELFNYIVENGKLGETGARRFFQQMMYGVGYSHSLKIIHRDIKPENVLLDDDLNVKLADFGLSNEISDGDFLKTSCGSPNYAAPEVIAGKLYAGPEIDVWSCGVILYVMLCGRLPFEDEHVPNLFRKITAGVYHVPSYLSPEAKRLVAGMLAVDPMKRMSVPEVLSHPWTNVDLPAYLRRMQPQFVARPTLDSLSSLLATPRAIGVDTDSTTDPDPSFIQGIGKVNNAVVIELASRIGVGAFDVKTALSADHNNAVQVAYKLCIDRNLGRNLDAVGEEEGPSPAAPGSSNPVWIPAPKQISGPSETRRPIPVYDDEYFSDENPDADGDEEDDDDDGTYDGEIDWTESNNFAVLDSSLVGEGPVVERGQLLNPEHHLASYASSRSAAFRAGPSGTRSPVPRSSKNHRIHPPRWHFGIRSSSPPMEVMLEIYRTLQTLGIQWREKSGIWAVHPKPESDVPRRHRGGNEDSDDFDMDTKESRDIYFVETRWRVRGVVVLMDLQLYQVDASNYLVDFRDLGIYKADPSPDAASSFDPSPPSSNGTLDDPTREKKGERENNALIFLECACRLIIELAGG